MKNKTLNYIRNALLLSTIVSIGMHLFIIYDGPQQIYRIIKKVDFTSKELLTLNSIEVQLAELESKQSAPKELIEEVQANKEAFNQLRKELDNPYKSGEVIQALKEYQESQGKLEGYSKYREEDKKILRESLEDEVNQIKAEADKRTFGTSSFSKFIDKGNDKKFDKATDQTQSSSNASMKVSLISYEEFQEKKLQIKSTEEECIDQFSYIGIGVAFGAGDNSIEDLMDNGFWKVTAIANGYGADKADIRVGDIILGAFDLDGKFTEGISFIRDNMRFKDKKMKILLNRNGKPLSKNVILSKICYKPN